MRMALLLTALLIAPAVQAQTTAATAAAAAAGEETPLHKRAADALAVLQGKQPAEAVFAPSFLQQVSPAQLAEITRQLTTAHGVPTAVERVTPDGPASAAIAIRFERAVGHGVLAIEPQAPHRITGLLLQRFEAIDDSPAKIEAELRALPGAVNAWFGPLAGGSPLISVNADQPLALGSTFKLFVLSTLSRAIERGEHRWDEVVPLTVRSYPSGVMHLWRQGSPATLETLATLMMQISDNTATDQLIALLGRARVEAEFRRLVQQGGDRTLPFLTTREFFVIKSDPALRARYELASEAERRRMLAELPGQAVPTATVERAFAGSPMSIERIEWFASPAALAGLMRGLSRPQATRAREVLASARNLDEATIARWHYVGFKGGSEPGVLNLTWLLQDQAGSWHMLSVGWNNPAAPVTAPTLQALANRMLALAR